MAKQRMPGQLVPIDKVNADVNLWNENGLAGIKLYVAGFTSNRLGS